MEVQTNAGVYKKFWLRSKLLKRSDAAVSAFQGLFASLAFTGTRLPRVSESPGIVQRQYGMQ